MELLHPRTYHWTNLYFWPLNSFQWAKAKKATVWAILKNSNSEVWKRKRRMPFLKLEITSDWLFLWPSVDGALTTVTGVPGSCTKLYPSHSPQNRKFPPKKILPMLSSLRAIWMGEMTFSIVFLDEVTFACQSSVLHQDRAMERCCKTCRGLPCYWSF